MSIRSMAARSALRSAQDVGTAPNGSVVMSVIPAAGGADGSPPTAPSSPLGQFMDKVTAWIPSEAVGLFVVLAGSFSVYEDTGKETALGLTVAALTVVYAVMASRSAHQRRALPFRGRDAARTGALPLLAFLAWWAALPGSIVTDPDDWAVDPYWVALPLAVFALALPFVAKALKVEPQTASG